MILLQGVSGLPVIKIALLLAYFSHSEVVCLKIEVSRAFIIGASLAGECECGQL